MFHANRLVALGLGLALLVTSRSASAGLTLTTLVNFGGGQPGTNGGNPEGGVAFDAHGNLFGTTSAGGTDGVGTVYELTAGTRTLVTYTGAGLYQNAAGPFGTPVFDSRGNLYGTTLGGVYEMTPSGTFSTLANLNTTISKVTIDSHGNLFGTTTYDSGGATGNGKVFEIAAGTTGATTVANFIGPDGANPSIRSGLILDANGNLFGTTRFGGANGQGAVFEVVAGSSQITLLASLGGSVGSLPIGGLTMDAHGNLFGTTGYGGTNDNGTVFELAVGSHQVTTLASFNGSNGNQPIGDLVMDDWGNLYGTTILGGDSNLGTVFELAAGSDSITSLVSFNGANGSTPHAGVTLDDQGNIYGTTYYGGTSNAGTVFELSAVPEPTSLLATGQALLLVIVAASRRRTPATTFRGSSAPHPA